jgi:hypothetical protein
MHSAPSFFGLFTRVLTGRTNSRSAGEGCSKSCREATAARQEWSALKTCPRKTQSVTSGEKMRSSQPVTAVSACAMTSSVRTSVNGRSPS